MTDLTPEARELSIGELDAVSGGSMLNMAIAAAERYLQGVGQRLMDAIHPRRPVAFACASAGSQTTIERPPHSAASLILLNVCFGAEGNTHQCCRNNRLPGVNRACLRVR